MVGTDDGRPFQPNRLPQGTVVSARLDFPSGLDVADADQVAAEHDEVSVQWAGFGVTPLREDEGMMSSTWRAWTDAGYSACHTATDPSRGGRGEVPDPDPEQHGVEFALDQARRATAQLAASPEISETLADASVPVLRRLDEVAAWLDDTRPPVVALVVTGPTEAVAEVAEASGADSARQLGVELYNGPGTGCA